MTLLIVYRFFDLFTSGLNQFIVPVGLYNGGFWALPSSYDISCQTGSVSVGDTNITWYLLFYFEYTVAGGFRETFLGRNFLLKPFVFAGTACFDCSADCRSFTGRRTFDGLCSRR